MAHYGKMKSGSRPNSPGGKGGSTVAHKGTMGTGSGYGGCKGHMGQGMGAGSTQRKGTMGR